MTGMEMTFVNDLQRGRGEAGIYFRLKKFNVGRHRKFTYMAWEMAESVNRSFCVWHNQMSILVVAPFRDHNQAMEIKSPYFDSIRINRRGTKKKTESSGQGQACQWDGCSKPATHRAPMGREYEGQYLHFCFDHVREYNKSYNYFSGLDDDSIAKFQKDSMTGHRPTWTMGVNKWGDEKPLSDGDPRTASARMRAKLNGTSNAQGARPRKLRTLEKKALDELGLAHNARGDEIKNRYKDLVKRHHPDANGGDRSSEDKLRQIIHAYKYLKQAGFC